MNFESDRVKIATALAKCGEYYPSFTYPWKGLEAWMENSSLPQLPLVGYGSLISQASAERTINVDSQSRRKSVRAFGAKRIFNYRMPPSLLQERYHTPLSSPFVAALNCEASGEAEDQFNGILTHVDIDRLDPLREREKHYSLKPIVFTDWEKTDAELQTGYIFELLPNPSVKGYYPYDDSILPHVEYVELCRKGAAAISESFLDFFDTTCILADKTTTLSQYLKRR
ncbi:hypothetical protein VDG1235_4416 [Verrucomicrobiia bacterium DG1235]|nr:hypothetical protein VDG1235_4416 [Verrucomicrobiae bacterium DG1235]